jgi:ubiquinone biosynthesis protein UbiJ
MHAACVHDDYLTAMAGAGRYSGRVFTAERNMSRAVPAARSPRELAKVQMQLKACTEKVTRLERQVERLTELLAELQEKIRF